MDKDDLLQHAQGLATAALRSTAPLAPRRHTHPDHLVHWWDNLIEGVTRADCEADLAQGDGAETDDREYASGAVSPAKFCAPYSSSALAVNTFGPFRHHPDRLRLDGRTGFTVTQFEYRCRNGLRTQHPPHFDFFADGPDGVIAVESKFLEPLIEHEVKFKPQYDRPFRGADRYPVIVEPPWRLVYEELQAGELRFAHLDAAQLIKHYLGLKVKFNDNHRTLLYLFWEPGNWEQIDEFRTHRHEARVFSDLVNRCATRFVFLSYRELWQDWAQYSAWPGMGAHLTRLSARYDFSL